jgi:hypothetical protein
MRQEIMVMNEREDIELQRVNTSTEKKKSIRRELSRRLSLTKRAAPYQVHFPPHKPLKDQNYIRTTKYTLLTFLPLNLFFQVCSDNVSFDAFTTFISYWEH